MKFIKSDTSRLRVFNNVLTAVVVVMSLYIMTFPFIPHIGLWIDRQADTTQGFRYQSALSEQAGIKSDSLPEAPDENTLVVPGIAVDDTVYESQDASALKKGIWRRPHTSTPDQGGNTVFVAHRFSYDDPSVFYHLDKVEPGEKFVVFWEGEEYVYETFDISIVTPDQIQIEAPTSEPIVTLYTCTPIWTARDRLVVKARLVSTTNSAENPGAEDDQTEDSGSPLLQGNFNNFFSEEGGV